MKYTVKQLTERLVIINDELLIDAMSDGTLTSERTIKLVNQAYRIEKALVDAEQAQQALLTQEFLNRPNRYSV